MSRESSIRRREFLVKTGAAATVCATGLAVTESDAAAGKRRNRKRGKTKPQSLYDLTEDDFAKLVGQEFKVAGSNFLDTQHHGKLVLKQVVGRDHPSDRDRPTQLRASGFSLLFVARANEELADGTHLVSGGGFAPCDLFLHETPEDRDPHHKHYEVVFN